MDDRPKVTKKAKRRKRAKRSVPKRTERYDSPEESYAPAPKVTVRTPAVATPGRSGPKFYWPADSPLPETYQRQRRMPCPECRRISLDTTSQAVVVKVTSAHLAYLLCRGCGHQWQLPLA